MSRPLVSVVVPTYQNASYVQRTLDSLLAQTWPALEVVVADHSSTDGTWELLQPYGDDPRVRLLRTPAGGGAERNWNRVTEQAAGSYLKLVCGDDVLHPRSLELQVEALERHPSAVLAAARRDLVDVHDRVLLRGRGLPGMSGLVSGRTAVRRAVRAGSNVFGEPVCTLLRTSVVREVGGWSARHPYAIDEDLYLKVLAHGDLVALPESLAAFRISTTQWSVELARDQARQVADLHRSVRREQPDAVSSADVRVGTARAHVVAVQRRAAYLLWSRRMRAAAAGGTRPAGRTSVQW